MCVCEREGSGKTELLSDCEGERRKIGRDAGDWIQSFGASSLAIFVSRNFVAPFEWILVLVCRRGESVACWRELTFICTLAARPENNRVLFPFWENLSFVTRRRCFLSLR